MNLILLTQDEKKVKVDTGSDIQLYSAPHNPPNTGTRYTSGTDLYFHRARSGNEYYYTHDWSMWQGSEDSFELISKEKAENILLQNWNNQYGNVKEDEVKKLFPDIDEENA